MSTYVLLVYWMNDGYVSKYCDLYVTSIISIHTLMVTIFSLYSSSTSYFYQTVPSKFWNRLWELGAVVVPGYTQVLQLALGFLISHSSLGPISYNYWQTEVSQPSHTVSTDATIISHRSRIFQKWGLLKNSQLSWFLPTE